MDASLPTDRSVVPPDPQDLFASGRENAVRRKVTRLAAALFSPPYLPARLIALAAVWMLIDLLVMLKRQPAAYWAVGKDFFGPTLPGGLALDSLPKLLVGCLVYFVLATLLMAFLTRWAAFMCWMLYYLVHGFSIYAGLSCSWWAFSPATIRAACPAVDFALLLGMALVWSLGLVGGAALLRGQPRSRAYHLALGGALFGLAALAVAVALKISTPLAEWRPLEVTSAPSPRSFANLAYDLRRQRAVLFGGTQGWDEKGWIGMNETWEWDGQTWLQLTPVESPPARFNGFMAYDEKRGVSVLFGGDTNNEQGALGDTWEWDGSQWIERTSLNRPAPRCCGEMIYDPHREAVVLLFGYASAFTPPDLKNTFYYDAWQWDGQDWWPITLEKDETQQGFAMTYDPLRQSPLIMTIDGQWDWLGMRIEQPQYPAQPKGRYQSGLAYDARQAAIILFGGLRYEEHLNDTWRFDGQNWQLLYTRSTPDGREGQVMFYDPLRGKVVLFGGLAEEGKFLGDTWELVLP